MNSVSSFVKYQRKRLKLTQEELASKAGVGIRFIRELEQGKETLQMNKVNLVLDMFGFTLSPSKVQLDPYDVFLNYLKKSIRITLANLITKEGVLIEGVLDKKENKIYSWKFLPNKNIIKYQQKPNDGLIEIILHSDIQTIEEQ